MPELRKDPIVGRWVIIATERARRPGNIVDDSDVRPEDPHCPYCANEPAINTPEIYRIPDNRSQRTADWRVKVISRQVPILKEEKYFSRTGHSLYDVVNGYGAHEVVVETPQHIGNMADLDEEQIRLVFEAYVVRFNALEQNELLKYVLAYKNYGWSAGSSPFAHSRSQIVAAPVNPLRVKDKLHGAKQYFDYHERCLYCDLIRQELDSKIRVLVETEHFVAITPFAARFLFELWIIPKKHHGYFAKGVIGFEADLAKIMKIVLRKIKVGLNDPAYNFVIQTAPFKRKSTKGPHWKSIDEDYHWHIEVMPRLTRVAGFEKGSGFYICPIPPEDTAEYLRGVEI